MSRGVFFLVLTLAVPATTFAQGASIQVEALSETSRAMFRTPSTFVLRSAEQMPADQYSFKPTPEVRSFGELIGHIADGYRLVCSMAMGEKPPAEVQQTEKTKHTKPELLAALAETSAICDRAHTALAGPKGADVVDFFGTKYHAVALLFVATSHTWEHYGNVVTYFRLKGLVPPSSQPRTRPSAQP